MQRRGFIASMLAACAAPAFVPAGNLMRVVAPPQAIWLPPAWTGADLSDLIYRITPVETPFLAALSSDHAADALRHFWRQPAHEWIKQ